MTVAENIKRIRKEKGLTQKQLGEKCGMSESALRQYELGLRNPKVETIQKLATALGVSLSELDKRSYEMYTNHLVDTYFTSEESHLQELVNKINYLPGYAFHSELGLPGRYEMVNREELIDELWIDYPDGDRLCIDYSDLFSLNEETDDYLKFKLEELRKKKQK